MLNSTLTIIRYAARKLKSTSTAQAVGQTAQKVKQKTKFSQDEVLQMAGFKEGGRSSMKIFKENLLSRTKNKEKITKQQEQYEQDNIQQSQQQEQKSNYQKMAPTYKSKYMKYKSPNTQKSQRLTPQQITLQQLSRIRLQPQYLPPQFMNRVKKVFHKYSQPQLRQIAEHFAYYTKLRYSEEKVDYEAYQELGFNKLELKPLPGGPKVEEPIYLIGRDKIYENKNQEQNAEKIRKIDSDPIDNDISYTQNIVVSYLLLRMPKTFSVAVRVFTQIRYKFNNFKPKSFIDFGSGLSSGSLAYLDVFQTQGQNVYAVEPAPKMRKMSQYLNSEVVQHFKSLGQLSIKVKTVDIVYAGYVLNELNPDLVEVFLQALWAKVNKQGFLVIAEHGTPFGARLMHQTRKWILKKQNAFIAAPCPHHLKCPLARSKQYCHFDQPVGMYPRQVFGKLPNDNQVKNEKFTYLIIQKTDKQQDQQTIEPNVTNQWDRVIFPLIKGGGHFNVNLCTKTGKFERRVIAKSHGQSYKQGRKLRWGDLWRFGTRIPHKFRKQRKTGRRLW